MRWILWCFVAATDIVAASGNLMKFKASTNLLVLAAILAPAKGRERHAGKRSPLRLIHNPALSSLRDPSPRAKIRYSAYRSQSGWRRTPSTLGVQQPASHDGSDKTNKTKPVL